MSEEKINCRICGCTEDNACVGGLFGACWWVEEDLCSACATKKLEGEK